MDWIGRWDHLKKYRIVLLVALFGIVLMIIPEKKEEIQITESSIVLETEDLEKKLSRLLSNLAGAGTVEVLLTLKEGEQTIFQNDVIQNESDIRQDTVLITSAERSEQGLIRQVNPPVYRGAIVICQGADQVQVRLAIVEAVKSATGLSSDRITVLKMK